MTTYIVPLNSPESVLAVSGGKGANLSQLLQAGFPVPSGFVITTAAYRAFVQANDLANRIETLSRQTSPDDPDSFERASDSIRQFFDHGNIPAEITQSILASYSDLGPRTSDFGLPVAVRSSATAEDLPDASFAGQQETYLNVRGKEALLNAVKKCWSSLWTARAIAYRQRQNIVPMAVSLAIVVQEMAPAEAAGILFTVNPVTGQRDEVVINAAWGLGEAIVGGKVNPDTVIVDKATGNVRSVELGDKAVMTMATTIGTGEVVVDTARRRQQAITSEQVAELARISRDIEAHFGAPQDIEWAIAGGKVYILQSRPVTAITPPPSATEEQLGVGAVPGDDHWPPFSDLPPKPYDLWTQADVGERWPEPVTPLTWSSTPLSMTGNLRHSLREAKLPYLDELQFAKRFYGRVYFNEGAFGHAFAEGYHISASVTAEALGSQVKAESNRQSAFDFGVMLRHFPLMSQMMLNRMTSERKLPALHPEIERWVADFLRRDLSPLTDRELWTEAEQVWNKRLDDTIKLYADLSGTAMTVPLFLESFLKDWPNRKELAQTLIKGLSGVHTAEMVPAMWRMARKVTELGLARLVLDHDPKTVLETLRATPNAQPVLQMLDEFLQKHGHRCATEAEWLHPRWIEVPEQVVESIAGYVRLGDSFNPEEAEARQRRQREEAVAATEAKLNPLRKLIFRGLLARSHHLVRLRDNSQHFLVKLLLPIRRLYALLGERWVARQWLDRADDIFFLVHAEIEQIIRAGHPDAAKLDVHKIVSERRKAYEYWFSVTTPEVIGPDGKPVVTQTAEEATGTTLSGIAGSSGKAKGTARIIGHPREAARLHQGDILVTRSTDPGWTPVFPLVSALVLEVGGQLSHGAIVAREYGIPAVLNVADATQRIQDGQVITVDGTSGRVYLSH